MSRSSKFISGLSLFSGLLILAATLAGFPLWLDTPARLNPFDPQSKLFVLPPTAVPPALTATITATPSTTSTSSTTPTWTVTPTDTPFAGSPTHSPTFSATPTVTASFSMTASPSPSTTPTVTPTRTCAPSLKVHILYKINMGSADGTATCTDPSDYCLHAWAGGWNDSGYTPPIDIESSYYPIGGPYDSGDDVLLGTHMDQMKAAGAGVVIAWALRPSQVDTGNTGDPNFPAGLPYEWSDQQIPRVLNAAQAKGLQVAFMKGLWPPDTMADIQEDIDYIVTNYGSHPATFKEGGKPVIYMDGMWRNEMLVAPNTPYDWGTLNGTGAYIMGDVPDKVTTAASVYGGIFGWDGGGNAGDRALTTTYSLKYSAGVRPGWDNTRNATEATSRTNGSRYTTEWNTATTVATSDWIFLNSFNNWREGTQIEPATGSPPTPTSGSPYITYEGHFGATGAAAENIYITKTREYVSVFDPASCN